MKKPTPSELLDKLRSDLRSLRTAVQVLISQTGDLDRAIKAQAAHTPPEPSPVLWKQADGKTVKVTDMTTDHISNCLFGGFTQAGSPAREAMEAELRKRAEKANATLGVPTKHTCRYVFREEQ